MSCGNPEHEALERDLEGALSDVFRLEEELQDAKAAAGKAGGALPDVALEDIERVIEENANLTREREKFQQDWLIARDRGNDLETQLEERQDRLRESERLRKRLEEDLESARANLAAEKAKAAAATRKVGDADRSRRTGQREQVQALQELQELRTHCDDVEKQLAERDGLIQELSESNQQLVEQLDDLTGQKEALRLELSEKVEELQAARRDLADASDQLSIAREAEEDTERRMAAAAAAAAAADAAAAQAGEIAARQLAAAREEAARLRDGSAAAARQQDLAALAKQVESMTAELALRGEALNQADADLEDLTARLEAAERRAAAAERGSGVVGASLVAGGGKSGGVAATDPRTAQRIAALEDRVKEEATRRGEMERRKDEAERRLEEAEAWKERYEAGHGLEEAARHAKQLTRDAKRLQRELESRGQLLGEALDAKEVLLLTCERLKREAGKPPDFAYADIPALRAEHQSEVERLRAVQAEMERQIDEKEEERLRLLQRLQENAAAVSDKGMRFVGLDAAQLEKVSEFARSLRDGTITLPMDNRSAELKRELREAHEECRRKDRLIERLDHDLAAAERHAAAAEAAAAVAANASASAGAEAGAGGRSGVSNACGGGANGSSDKAMDSSVMPELARLREELSSLVKDGFSKLKPATARAAARKDTNKNSAAGKAGKGGTATGEEATDDADDPLAEEEDGDNEGDETPRRHEAPRSGGYSGRNNKAAAASAIAAGTGAEGAGALQRRQVQVRQQATMVKAADEVLRQLKQACERLEAANKNSSAAAAVAAAAAQGESSGGSNSGKAAAEAQRLAGEVARLQLLLAALAPVPPAEQKRVGDQSAPKEGGVLASSSQVAAGVAAALFGGSQQQQQQQQQALGSESLPPGPRSASGKEALSRELRRLRLPPEEWADEVREVHSRLAEALEQLGEREAELDQQEELVKRYESHLSSMRGQVATLYRQHAEAEAAAAAKHKELTQEVSHLSEQRDALQTRVRHATAVLDAEDAAAAGDDPISPLQKALREASRKLVVYEVNEAVLARRYTSLSEQLRLESEARQAAEKDIIEVEAAGRSRILFLEQWKAGATQRLDRLQRELEESVPASELSSAERELKSLRGDYLFLLEREAEARVTVVQQGDVTKRLHAAEAAEAALAAQLAEAQEARLQSNSALAQRDRLVRAAAAGGAAAAGRGDFSQLMEEAAKAQRDAAKAASERAAVQVRLEWTAKRLSSAEEECAAHKERLEAAELRLRQGRRELEECKREMLTLQDRFADGLPSSEAAQLRQKLLDSEERLAVAVREAERCREVADVASSQATAVAALRQSGEDELQELRRHVAELESRGDDDIIIGRLQRRLMALKLAYRAFARKHEATRANLRRKAVAARLLEGRLDRREEAMYDLQEEARRRVSSLKAALAQLADRGLLPGEDADARLLGLAAARDMAGRVRFMEGRLAEAEAAAREATAAATKEAAVAEAAAEERKSLERQVLDLRNALEHMSVATTAAAAPTAAADGNGSSPSAAGNAAASGRAASGTAAAAVAGREVARRLVALSEEVRAAKVEALDARRQLQVARDEKRHLEGVAAAASDHARRLEEAVAQAEARSLLGLGPKPTGNHGGRKDGGDDDSGAADAVSLALALGLGPGEGAGMVLLSPRANLGGGGVGAPGAGGVGAAGGFGSTNGMSEEERRMLEVAMAPAEGDFGGMDPEEALERLRGASRKISTMAKELSEAKLERARLRERMEALEHAVGDQKRQIRYYERLADEHRLPLLTATLPAAHGDGDNANNDADDGSEDISETDDGGGGHGGRGGGGSQRRRRAELRRGQRQLQEAAAITVSSLKKIIEDKNAALERYKHKLEEAREAQRRHAAAERHEVARLTDKAYRNNVDALEQLRLAVRQLHGSPNMDGAGVALSGRLMEQLEDFAAMVGERDEAAREMELRLRTALNQKERAEGRCGEAVQEVESLKGDVATLAQQLQESEERNLRLTEQHADGGPQAKRVAELRRALLAKEGKLRALRAAVVGLKQEFVLSEERREQATLAGERQKGRRVDDRAAELANTATALRGQIEELEKGLAEAKEDAVTQRRAATRFRRDCEDLQKEKAKLSSKLEANAATAAEAAKALTRARRERDEAREAEQKTRAKLKLKSAALRHGKTSDADEGEFKDGGGGGEGKDGGYDSAGGGTGRGGGEAAARRIADLMRRVQVLTAQNAALRSAIAPGGGNVLGSATLPIDAATAATKEADPAAAAVTGGRRLGTREEDRLAATAAAAGTGGRPTGEEERRLRRRVETLEKRLAEKAIELQAAESQTAQARELLSRAGKEKEVLQRLLADKGGNSAAGGGRRPASAASGESHAKGDGAREASLQAARARVFELEEENSELRKQAEVRLPREIEALKHEVRQLRQQLDSTDGELEREQRAHRAAVAQLRRAAAGDTTAAGGLLRAEEECFHEKEAMRDELAAARTARRNLERELLDRDADAMEMRFELEAASAEAERLRRRLSELHAVTAALSSATTNGGGSAGSAARGAGGRFKRERDLEGVVDALKRVVEKLRGENERLRRGAADGARVADAERKARESRQQLEEARKEGEALKTRALAGEEAVQRLAQRQEALNRARRQVRGRDEELRLARQQLQEAEAARDALSDELEQANRALTTHATQAATLARAADMQSTSTAAASTNAALREEAMRLRERLAEAERELQRAARRSDMGVSRSSAGIADGDAAELANLEDENDRLRRENERLNGELQAFDLDFFEEIEDLKYKYSLAVKKLRQYESVADASGPGVMSGSGTGGGSQRSRQ